MKHRIQHNELFEEHRTSMPIRVTHLHNGGILLKGEGIVTGRDLREINTSLYCSPESIQKIRYQLCDFTHVSDFLVSNSEIRDLAKQDKKAAEINPSMLIALVGARDFIFGLIRMWVAYTYDSPGEIMAFRNIEEADKWIEATFAKNHGYYMKHRNGCDCSRQNMYCSDCYPDISQ